jgi:hypothetical protein
MFTSTKLTWVQYGSPPDLDMRFLRLPVLSPLRKGSLERMIFRATRGNVRPIRSIKQPSPTLKPACCSRVCLIFYKGESYRIQAQEDL